METQSSLLKEEIYQWTSHAFWSWPKEICFPENFRIFLLKERRSCCRRTSLNGNTRETSGFVFSSNHSCQGHCYGPLPYRLVTRVTVVSLEHSEVHVMYLVTRVTVVNLEHNM